MPQKGHILNLQMLETTKYTFIIENLNHENYSGQELSKSTSLYTTLYTLQQRGWHAPCTAWGCRPPPWERSQESYSQQPPSLPSTVHAAVGWGRALDDTSGSCLWHPTQLEYTLCRNKSTGYNVCHWCTASNVCHWLTLSLLPLSLISPFTATCNSRLWPVFSQQYTLKLELYPLWCFRSAIFIYNVFQTRDRIYTEIAFSFKVTFSIHEFNICTNFTE